MSTQRERRILKELADIQADRDNSGVFAQPISENNVLHLKGTIPGPPDTPYAGGRFIVDIVIPDNYPFKSPIMKFDTKIWHPNISSQTVSPPFAVLPTVLSPTSLPLFLSLACPFPLLCGTLTRVSTTFVRAPSVSTL